MTDMILIKLALTPLFIAGLTLIGRRWGPAVSGAIAGLPLTSGPVSVFLACEQGKNFAANAAIGTLAGMIAVAAFCLSYAAVAGRSSWFLSTLAGVAAFLIFTDLLWFSSFGIIATSVAVVFFLVLVLRIMPSAIGDARNVPPPVPRWDLALRMFIATALVFLLTAVAPKLGPHLTGLVSPFPVFGGILAIFAHRHGGALEANHVLRGVVRASFSFAAFFVIVGSMLPRFSLALTYAIATVVALTSNAAWISHQRVRINNAS